jgi:hypothetical protein
VKEGAAPGSPQRRGFPCLVRPAGVGVAGRASNWRGRKELTTVRTRRARQRREVVWAGAAVTVGLYGRRRWMALGVLTAIESPRFEESRAQRVWRLGAPTSAS